MTRCLVTLSEGIWWRIRYPDTAALMLAERIDGVAFLVDVDETARTARLVRAIRGDGPARLAHWCRVHGFTPIGIPNTPPAPSALAARPTISL